MSNIVQIQDFKGFYKIPNNCFDKDYFQHYIDKYEDYYLNELLGVNLKTLLIADLVNGVPLDPSYLEWFNPFTERFNCEDEVRQSIGLKNVLLGLIYYSYTHSNQYSQSLTGVVVSSNENSEMLRPANVERVAEVRYNDSVPSYNNIAYKLCVDDIYRYSNELEIKTLFV